MKSASGAAAGFTPRSETTCLATKWRLCMSVRKVSVLLLNINAMYTQNKRWYRERIARRTVPVEILSSAAQLYRKSSFLFSGNIARKMTKSQ